MKHITKKALSLFLSLCLTLSCATVAMAAQTDTRQTSFFPHDLYHTDQNFSELAYQHIEVEPLLEKIQQIRDLMGDTANAAEVERMFWEVDDQMLKLDTMIMFLTIRSYMDVYDEEVAETLSNDSQAAETLEDALFALTRDLLSSPCDAFLRKVLSEEQLKKYLEYGEMDPNLVTLSAKENELSAKAAGLLAKTYTAEYGGKEWDLNRVAEAKSSGALSEKDADTIEASIYAVKNAELGKLYLELLAVRRDIAKASGYSNYPEYSYQETHFRDYTPAEARRLYADVKEYIVPLFTKVNALNSANEAANKAFFNHDFVGTGDDLLNLVAPYIGRISSELLESFTYMREHKMYDTQRSDSKFPNSFSVDLASFGAAFYFQYPNDTMNDFSGTVHEFGHYNNSYYSAYGKDQHYITTQNECTDTAEVHSQGFELMFSQFYPEVFGDDAGLANIYLHSALLRAIVIGALYDEFQQYAYTTENVTLKQLNEKFYQLTKEYGITVIAQGNEGYNWVNINHNFMAPCYYISYATSAAGAYTFWSAAQSDYFSAVDKYLEFVALGADPGFQASFGAVGMTNPLSTGYLKELSETLSEKLPLSEEADNAFFTLTAGGTELDTTKFSTMSYAEAETIFYAANYNAEGTTVPVVATALDAEDSVVIDLVLEGEPSFDGEPHNGASLFVDLTSENTIENPVYVGVKYIPNKEGVTEAKPYDEYFKVALYMVPATTSSFTDVSAGAYYADAVAWAVQNSVTNGMGNGRFGSELGCTRAQFVTFLWRAAGSPKPTDTENKFSDVSATTHASYYDAILWATQQGIAQGTGDGSTFSPDAVVNRAQSVTFMHRYARSASIATKTGAASFDDVVNEGSMTPYYDAIDWAVANGITAGNSTTKNTFGPMDDCSRAMMITFLHRLFTTVKA